MWIKKWWVIVGLFDCWFKVRILGFRSMDSGFKKSTLNHFLITRQLIPGYRRSIKKIKPSLALHHVPSNGQGSVWWWSCNTHNKICGVKQKLDGIALLITAPPWTSFTTLPLPPKKSDIWHVTHDTWTFSQNWVWMFVEEIFTKDDSNTDLLMNKWKRCL